MSEEKKIVVLGGDAFLVDVLGENPSIKGSFYVRYNDGGTDSFKPRFLINPPESYILTMAELEAKTEENRKLREFVEMVENASSADNNAKAIMVHSFIHSAKQLLKELK